MRINQHVPRLIVAALVAQALVACGGMGVAPRGQTLSGFAPAAVPAMRASWIDAHAKSGALLYVSDAYANTVSIYSYPQLARVGQLTGFYFVNGMCVDKRDGNVWVMDAFHYKVIEYAHGGTVPIRTIPENTAYPRACAVHPKSGDLAVITDVGDEDPSYVLLFKPGRSVPKYYSDFFHAYSMWFGGYDPHGNLYIDADRFEYPGPFALDLLIRGTRQLRNLRWSGPPIALPSGVQYDGTYMAIGDEQKHLIYRTNGGNVVSTVRLKHACLVQQFFIYGGLVIAPSWCGSSGDVLIYNYPAGGDPVRRLTGFQQPFAAVISP